MQDVVPPAEEAARPSFASVDGQVIVNEDIRGQVC